jgi:hypothetical protein
VPVRRSRLTSFFDRVAAGSLSPLTAATLAGLSLLLFPAREFADAVLELQLTTETAAPFVPEAQRHALFSHHDTLLNPGYEPWSYWRSPANRKSCVRAGTQSSQPSRGGTIPKL